MSKRTGDKSRANRQQKHKMLMRKHSRELGKPVEKETETNLAEDGNPIFSSRLPQLTVDDKTDPTPLEIVVTQPPQGAAND